VLNATTHFDPAASSCAVKGGERGREEEKKERKKEREG